MQPSLLLTALFLWSATTAGACPEDDELLCGDCHTTGKVDNPKAHSKYKDEQDVVYCSRVMRADPDAYGLDFLVCPKCKTPSAQESARRDFERQRKRRSDWLEEREKEVDQLVGHEMVHIRTKHFVIAWDIPKIKVNRRVLKPHDAAHLYAERAEELYEQILELHGINERRTAGTTHYLYVFEREKDAKNAGARLTTGGGSGRSSKYGNVSRFICWQDKSKFKKDEEFHQAFVHVVAHHIYNDVEVLRNWLNKRYGWVFVGLGHFWEIRNFGPPNTWCHREAGSGIVHWKGKGWEANVKKALQGDDHLTLADLIGRPAEDLSPKEHQFAWSYVDYLIWLDPTQLPRMIGHMKGPQLPDREAIKKAYDISIPQLQEGWEDFVRTEYAVRAKKGPQPREPKRRQVDADDGG